ncbi:unnamed protein product [Diabrotica balteata]|uniref:ubiquitinyl hydrolase 1 n=1 Tax=Diabrotica balteata TaxID=107213 RepID=A0A9N9SU69_DIABA|nr:unnamed protein product [Diabrotica balteata]
MKLKKLYISNNLTSLDSLAQRDKIINGLQKFNRVSNFSNKMLAELMQCQDDQEKCYILCKRYIHLMDHLFKISNDQNYLKVMYSNDYRRVEQLSMDLKDSLQERYKQLILENNIVNSSELSSVPVSKEKDESPTEKRKFQDKFIGPLDLFNLLQKNQNFLLVDIRPNKHYQACRINCKMGTLINIPEEVIVPGLSANTLGLRLNKSIQEVWEKRDSFDVIVLLDSDTTAYNYLGSKLERLRSFIVEWDTGRQYKEEPVILSGGLKEFVECYPSTVDNSHVFLSQTNCDIDELLDLDSIVYPEAGSVVQMRLKIHEVPVSDSEEDIVDEFITEGREETFTPSVENSSKSFEVNTVVMPPVNKVGAIKPNVDEASVKEILDSNKAAMLLMARKAAKPTFNTEIPKGPPIIRKSLDRKDVKSQNGTRSVVKPIVDRSFKPDNRIGDGFTGLKNVRNICYMNCLLQCLKVIPAIKLSYVTTDRYLSYTTRKPPKINHHLAAVLRELWGGTLSSHKTFYISQFKNRICEFAPIYDKGTHEDCFEFFIFLFTAVSEDCSADLPREMMTESEKAWYGQLQGRSSFWIDSFYFQLKNLKVCCNCRKVNPTYDTDSLLLLSVPNKACHLQNMVADYLKEVKLTDFSCNNCKFTDTIINKKELTVEPEILAIVLKRYMHSGDISNYVKNQAEVDFPLTNLRFGTSRYNLVSIVEHTGTMSHGHYFATVKLDNKRDDWYLFNDETITKYSRPVNDDPRIKISAAGFFYVRNSV